MRGLGRSFLSRLEDLAFERRPWNRRSDGIIAAALGFVVLWTRWVDAARTLYTVDSVLFALGMHEYDLMSLRPHPPGYPVFVALAKTATAVRGEENAGIVFVAIAFSILSVILLYALLRRFAGVLVSFASTVLFLVTPAFYFNGVIALSYTAEAAMSIAVALLALRFRDRPTWRRAALLGCVAAIGAGVRQSLVLFLGPLVAFALLVPWRGRQTLRTFGSAAGVSAATGLLWFLPMAYATGGIAEARRASQLQAETVVFADAVWNRGWVAAEEHLARLGHYLRAEGQYILPVVALLTVAGLILWVVRSRAVAFSSRQWWFAAFFTAWLVPAFAFYILVFNGWDRGPIGYVLTVLPGLYALLALLAQGTLDEWRRVAGRPNLRLGFALFGALILLLPASPLAADSADIVQREVRAHDEWSEEWSRIRDVLPPNETAILTWYSWAHVRWYFPDYLAWIYFPIVQQQEEGGPPSQVTGDQDWVLFWSARNRTDEARFLDLFLAGPGQPEHLVPPQIKRVVVFDVQLAGEDGSPRKLADDVNVTEVSAHGWRVLVFEVSQERPTIESYFRGISR